MEFLVNQTFNGLSYAALLFLLAGGMTLIFGVMRIINIAQGSFYLIGGFVGWFIIRHVANFFVAIVIASLVVGVLGMLIERFLIRGTEGQDLRQMLLTMGIVFCITDITNMIFKGYPLTIDPPSWAMGSIFAGDFYFPVIRIIVVGAAILVYVILWWLENKTKAGAMLRAAVDNRQVAQGFGMNVPLLSMSVFGLGTALAAVGGVVGGAVTAVYTGVDMEILPLIFVVVIVGGMGSLKGAALGALVVGLIDNYGKALIPEFSYFTLFIPMAIILAVKPTGLFGREG
jgi:branched-chain amino acid transport system permease protein